MAAAHKERRKRAVVFHTGETGKVKFVKGGVGEGRKAGAASKA